MKFGGTSIEDARAMRNVSAIVRQNLSRHPLVVASACAGVTNALLALARGALSGGAKSLAEVENLRLRHRKIAHELFSGDLLFTIQSQIDAMMDQLRDLVRSVSILGELTKRSLDVFASFGEKLSTLILYHQTRQDGIDSVLVNAQEVIVTTDDFTRGVPLFDEIERRAAQVLSPKIEAGQVVVTQGFIGATKEGVPTTIGRGGSDFSAAILGAVLKAAVIQIWTDVDGMMTSDPTVVRDAQPIPEITFREAAELAYFGAKVLHPSTIAPAVQKNIPVEILNSKHPVTRGTVIVARRSTLEETLVTSIAFKRGITVITIESTRMLMVHGFLARVFETFARFERSVDVIATSEVTITLTIDSEENLDAILTELRQFATVTVEKDKAVFCVVGEKLKQHQVIVARIFSTLHANGIPVSLISMGASEINVTFVIEGKDIRSAAEALHAEFFPPAKASLA
jgi:aspartate kinase